MMISFAFFSAARFASSSILLMILEASNLVSFSRFFNNTCFASSDVMPATRSSSFLWRSNSFRSSSSFSTVLLLFDLQHLFLLVDLVQALVDGLLFLLQPLLDVLELLPPVAALFLQRVLFFQELVLRFKEQLLPLVLRVLDRVLDDPLGLRLRGAELYPSKICAESISHCSYDRESYYKNDCQ